jgi:MoxR-like ATPase
VHLAAAARAAAAVDGRDFATPDDVSALALPILAHRVISAAGADTREIIDEIVSATRVRTG